MTADIDAMRAAIARDRYQFSEGCAPEDVLDALDELEAYRAALISTDEFVHLLRNNLDSAIQSLRRIAVSARDGFLRYEITAALVLDEITPDKPYFKNLMDAIRRRPKL